MGYKFTQVSGGTVYGLVRFEVLKENFEEHSLLDCNAECTTLRIFHLHTQMRISQNFMEPEISVPCSQEPSTVLYTEPVHTTPSYYSEITSFLPYLLTYLWS
jgi:hypothetical protein